MNDAHPLKRGALVLALAGFVCFLAVGRAQGGDGLYAIAGVPLSIDYSPVVLYRVQGGGLAKVRTLATPRQDPHVVRSYPEKGFVFVVSAGAFDGSFLVDILDLGNMALQRSVDFDVCAGCGSYVRARLLERNGRTIFYLHALGDGPDDTSVIHYLGLDMASGEFVRDIGRADVTYLHHAGAQSGGVDGDDHMGGIYVRDLDPGQPYVVSHSDTFDLRWRLPAWFSLPEGGRMRQVANNDHARVLSVRAPAADASRWLVFDKSAGRWLVREDFRDGVDRAAWDDVPGRPDPESVAVWPAEPQHDETPYWSAEFRAGLLSRTPTGRLRFDDTRTGNVAVHDTGHLDSEVLMIDDHDEVYFRVGDELRRGTLRDGETVNEETVAKAPELLVVHWLFRGVE